MCSRAKKTVAKVGKSLQNAMSHIVSFLPISNIIDHNAFFLFFYFFFPLAVVGEGYLVTSAFEYTVIDRTPSS